MAEAAAAATVSVRTRRVALAAIALAYLAITVPVGQRLGANAEEAVGLLRVAPERLYPEGEQVPRSETSGASGLRTSTRLPVWGYQAPDGAFAPIMIDGHVGAASFYPARLLARAGGLTAARLGSVALGLVGLLLVYALAFRIAGERVALIAAALAASSAHYGFLFGLVRPDEQLDSLAHVAAVLALLRFADGGRTRWLLIGALLLGVGVAAKNTAGWTLIGVAVALALLADRPRLRPGQWLAAAVVFALPLAPQLAFLACGESASAFSGRVAMLSAPWVGLAPDNLSFSLAHFADSIGHPGTSFGNYIAARAWTPIVPGLGYGLLVAALLAVASALSGRQPRPVRAFGAGLGVVLLLYWALYYRGESYYLLLAPWLPIAFALVGVGLWNAARSRAARAIVLGLAALVAVNAAGEAARLVVASGAPASAIFDRRAQQRLVDALAHEGVDRPYVTTYGGVGVLELLSDGAVRPRYLFPYFHAVARGDRGDYTRAWQQALDRLGSGVHAIVLVPSPSPLDTSPCEQGGYIAEQLRPAVAARGGRVDSASVIEARAGAAILELVRVTLP